MKAIREDMARDPKGFIKLVKNAQKKTGVKLTAKEYKRPPQEAPVPELERFYAWRGNIACVVEEEFSPETFGPELAQRVGDFLTKLIPLYEYLNRFKV